MSSLTEPSFDVPVGPHREPLVREAYHLIGSKGMQRMSLQDVADAAGVSKALVLYHFRTKEELVLTTMRWVLAEVARRTGAAIDSAESAEDKIRALVDAIFVDARRNRTFYLAYTDLIAHAVRNRRFTELNEAFRNIVNGQYADVIRAGSGVEFRTLNAEEAAIAVRALIDGHFLQWLEEDDWESAHALYQERCTTAVLDYLRCTPNAARRPSARP
jgi:TetR/AcrR family transcriptional regulator, fatty acid metabolism regulator protein